MTEISRFSSLTQYERVSLDRAFNLADAHAHQRQSATQAEIVARLPEIFAECERRSQLAIETDFQHAYFRTAGQSSALRHPRAMLCYSASLATDVVATFLCRAGISVRLLQPCFDNLVALLRRRGVLLTPVAESELAPTRLARTLRSMAQDALFLVLPNNPTGFVMSRDSFNRLATMCAEAGKVLIIDWTFRFFSSLDSWDQYEILERTGVSYMCIEDTGKTWPTQDLKCSILLCSADIHGQLADLHNDFLLNVSPVILALLTEYVRDAQRRGLESTVRQLVQRNRRSLRRVIDGSILRPGAPDATISVEWIRIESHGIRSADVVALFDEVGLGILPGDHFYWDDPSLGRRYIRIALARDPQTFLDACRRIDSCLVGLQALRRNA